MIVTFQWPGWPPTGFAVIVSFSWSDAHTGPRFGSAWVAPPDTDVVSECSGDVVTALNAGAVVAIAGTAAARLPPMTAAAAAALMMILFM